MSCTLPGLSGGFSSESLMTLLSGLSSSSTAVSNSAYPPYSVLLSGSSSLFTSESGTVQSFGLALNTAPTAPVTIPVTSSDTTEGLVSLDGITYFNTVNVVITPAAYSIPVIVYVKGQPDGITDGNIVYSVVTGTMISADANYSGRDPNDIPAVNFDIDLVPGTVGIAVAPSSGLVTAEGGGAARFAVVLQSQPIANVTVGLSSSNAAEGTVAPASLTFTNANWSTPQIVTVTGADDSVADGSIGYTIVTAAAVSVDAAYNGLNPADVTVTNTDNDTAGVTIAPISGLSVNEIGTTASFSVVLNSQPATGQQVQIDFSSTNPSKGTVSPASSIFTPANWNVPQTITVTGVDNAVADGNASYFINSSINGGGTTDPNYAVLGPFPSVSVTTVDNETVGITVSAISGNTGEAGASATFTIVLNSDPGSGTAVTVPLLSGDTTEGTVSSASVVFTGGTCPGPGNWCTAQTVTVTGVDDYIQDGNVGYSIITQPASSVPASLYSNYDAADVSVTNTDNDAAVVTLNDPGGAGLTIGEGGQTDLFMLVLNTQPNPGATVRIPLSVPAGRQQISLDNATWFTALNVDFTGTNWFVPQTVYVRSVNNTTMDHAFGTGQPSFTVTTGSVTIPVGADANYSGMNPADISGTNLEDEKFLFVTTVPHNGNFDGDPALAGAPWGANNGDTEGYTEADNACMKVGYGYPGFGNYKAVIIDGFARRASYTANLGDFQLDWVLKPSTVYYRIDGNQTMTTNGVGLFAFGSLVNSFDTAASNYWTGFFSAGWDTASNNCNYWANGTAGQTGSYGIGSATDGTSISNGAVSNCNLTKKLLCAEQ